jgi:hypothetical protein
MTIIKKPNDLYQQGSEGGIIYLSNIIGLPGSTHKYWY